MENSDQEPSDADWELEAEAVIKDIKAHVKKTFVSKKLLSSRQNVFINIETLEGTRYCIQLTSEGFRIVGKSFDQNTLTEERVFETPYSLLQSISPRYVSSFGAALVNKLKVLEDRT